MNPTLDQILASSDAGDTPAQIATALGMAPAKVYAILRRFRPDRPRAPRARTSSVPQKVLALHAAGIAAARIAALMGCSRAYVYMILKTRPAATSET